MKKKTENKEYARMIIRLYKELEKNIMSEEGHRNLLRTKGSKEWNNRNYQDEEIMLCQYNIKDIKKSIKYILEQFDEERINEIMNIVKRKIGMEIEL